MVVQRLQDKLLSWTSSKNKYMKKISSSRQNEVYVAKKNQIIKTFFLWPKKT
jgi:hypothetical protein